jgi:Helix-turn-helix
MTTTHVKLTPVKIKEFKALASKIDKQESSSIKARGRKAFERHQRLLKIIKRLRKEREKRGITLFQASRLTGIAKPNLSRLENSTSITPTLDTLSRYAEALGMTFAIRLTNAGTTGETGVSADSHARSHRLTQGHN